MLNKTCIFLVFATADTPWSYQEETFFFEIGPLNDLKIIIMKRYIIPDEKCIMRPLMVEVKPNFR